MTKGPVIKKTRITPKNEARLDAECSFVESNSIGRGWYVLTDGAGRYFHIHRDEIVMLEFLTRPEAECQTN